MKTGNHTSFLGQIFSSSLQWLGSDTGSNILTAALLAVILAVLVGLWRSPVWGDPLRRLSRNRLAMGCLVVMALYAGVAIMDSFRWADTPTASSRTILDRLFGGAAVERTYSRPLDRYDIQQRNLRRLKGRHYLGTDSLGNDVLFRSLKGIRTAWIVGGFTLVLSIPLAVLFGISAGYFGGIVDDVVQYIYITLSSIPPILLLITLMMVMGKGLFQICIAMAVTEWVGLCRLLRGETLKHREKEYVLGARAVGVHPIKILQRHILPNVMHLVIITATLSFSGLVQSEAILTYLGVGVPAGVGSWGNMIDSARTELAREPMVWWNLTGAASALFGLVLAANFFGDAVRDAFDPRLKES